MVAPNLRPPDPEWDAVDETTALVERRRAEERLVDANTGAQYTDSVVNAFRSIVNEMRAMHEQNDFARRLQPLYQGSRRA